jgi:hypothetical protein
MPKKIISLDWDFSLCGYIKDIVYKTTPITLENMEQKLQMKHERHKRDSLIQQQFLHRAIKCTEDANSKWPIFRIFFKLKFWDIDIVSKQKDSC